jgi:nucleoid-associated protein YgaU
MSVVRLATTAVAMAVVGLLLRALTPDFGDMAEALTAPQRTADTAGPDVLVLAAAAVLAWTVWAWGALGLALTAASALPGLVGQAARSLSHAVLPAGARRGAALLLGVGLGVAGPLVSTVTGVVPLPAATAAPTAGAPDWPEQSPPLGVPDWPAVSPSVAAPPDWPAGPEAGDQHVVVRGDCLWHIAAERLLDQLDRPPTDGEVARAVHAWWTANADVIGPDPDSLLPGQVLRPPPA